MSSHRQRRAQPREAASGLWRSEDMQKLNVVVPRDSIHHVVQAVAAAGCAQFIDMSAGATAFARPFTSDVRRCEDAERRLRFLREHMRQAGVAFDVPLADPDADPLAVPPVPFEALDELERVLEAREADLRNLNASLETLVDEGRRLREELEVATRDTTAEYVSLEARERVGLTTAPSLVVMGTIPARTEDSFLRMTTRATRGNAFIRTDPIDKPFITSFDPGAEPVRKTVFSIFVATEKLQQRVARIAETLGGNIFAADRSSLRSPDVLDRRLRNIDSTLAVTRGQRFQLLQSAARDFVEHHRIASTCKAVYAAMNLMQVGHSATAVAKVWVPTADLHDFAEAVRLGNDRSGGATVPIIEVCPKAEQTNHPTYFRTNAITGTFQGIVDSYGVARYKEVNPGVFTIVTFPYLFGIMYGDMGHGVLLTAFALCLLAFEKRLLRQNLNEIVAMIFGGRYLLLGMGVFAIYVGILYNDCFGFSVELFSSAYRWPRLPETTTDEHGVAHHTSGAMGTVRPLHPNGHPSVKPLHTYPFGIDVAWAETENKLEFYNSTKMKCAVIIGVIQMLAGIVLSLLNHLRKRDWRHVWFGFVPEFVFLSCTFGYMALLIMVKWVTPWENTNLAPSLLETMTNFFLAPGVVTLPVFAGQAHLQVLLLLLAFSMVPLLLCAIPYLELRDHRAAVAAEGLLSAGDDEEVELSVLPAPREEEVVDERASSEATAAAAAAAGEGHFDFSEVMIHYIIHTIEFVLGAVSNTASYLRLWALSLAHAQLSEVFLNFALVASIGADSGNGLTLYVGFALWLGATIGVLLGMESLSAFLHALRLHWVEFNGKFYAGDGKAFTPLKLAEVTAVA